MRTAKPAFFLSSVLTLAACAADPADESPQRGEEDLPSDAGHRPDASKPVDKDAGKSADARIANGSADAGPPDAGAPRPRDAGSSPAASDAGRASGSDAGVDSASGESGRMVGMTAAHNAVRAMVSSSTPLPLLTWSPTIAAFAQQWADEMAKTACSSPHHRTSDELQKKGYGENLASFGSTQGSSTAQMALDGWAGEVACWTFGTFFGTEKCDMACTTRMHSDGCGHYTQVVWRKSTELGCGVASCQNGAFKQDIWICNYGPAGNYVGQAPY